MTASLIRSALRFVAAMWRIFSLTLLQSILSAANNSLLSHRRFGCTLIGFLLIDSKQRMHGKIERKLQVVPNSEALLLLTQRK